MDKIFKALFCDFAVIPLPWKDLDLVVQEQIHGLAKKRVEYLKGTMALELQQPKDDMIKELIAKEEKELQMTAKLDIWQEGNFYDQR